jgi:hypothetical protein
MIKLQYNRKGQALSKTGILLVLIIFYTVILLFVGYINSYYNQNFAVNSTTPYGVSTTSNCDCGTLTCSEYALIYGDDAKNTLCATQTSTQGKLSFLGMIISGISDLPLWVNLIIFGSFAILVGWIIISSLPLWNGGS